GGDAVGPVGQTSPCLTVVVGRVEIRTIVAKQISVCGVVCRPFAMRRRVDVLDSAAWFQVLRCDVGPRSSVIARDIERTVVGASPDDAPFKRRLGDGVQRAVELFTSDVTCDRFATRT